MSMKCGVVAVVLITASLPAVAKDISNLGNITQDQFHQFSEDLGSALSYKPLNPAEPLCLFVFDLGVAATDTTVKNSDLFNAVGAGDVSNIAVPSLRFNL